MKLLLILFITIVVVVISLSFLYTELCDVVHGFFAPAPRGSQVEVLLKTGAGPHSEVKCPPTPNPSIVSTGSQAPALVTAESPATERVNSERIDSRTPKGALFSDKSGVGEQLKRSSATLDDKTQRIRMQTAKDAMSETSEMKISRCPSFEEDVKEAKGPVTASAAKKKGEAQLPAEGAPKPPADFPKEAPPGQAPESTPLPAEKPGPESPGSAAAVGGQEGLNATKPDEGYILKTAQLEATESMKSDYGQEKQTDKVTKEPGGA